MRKTCFALLLPIASLACTTDTEPEDAETTTSAFESDLSDCTITQTGGTVTLSCAHYGQSGQVRHRWTRFQPLTGTSELIAEFMIMPRGTVVVHDDHAGAAPIYELSVQPTGRRPGWYLPKGATSGDGLTRFVPTTKRTGTVAPLVPSAGCTVKRLSCTKDDVEARCTAGPGETFEIHGAPRGFGSLHTGTGRGTVIRPTIAPPGPWINDRTGAFVTPPGTTLNSKGRIVVPKCFVSGPRFPLDE